MMTRSWTKGAYRNKKNWRILVRGPLEATLEFLGRDRDIDNQDEKIFLLMDAWTSETMEKPEKYNFTFEPLDELGEVTGRKFLYRITQDF